MSCLLDIGLRDRLREGVSYRDALHVMKYVSMLVEEGDWSVSAVEPECLHGNAHFARQFRCFPRQFYNSNHNLTMKNGKSGKTTMITFLIFRIPKLPLNMKSD